MTDTETEEIRKIKHRLDSDEKVEILAKQLRIHPGGSATSPNIIFITNKRIIIKNPSLLGARENYESITYIWRVLVPNISPRLLSIAWKMTLPKG